MIKVVLSYIKYPLAMGSWFERALRRRDDIELSTVGPYTGSWIPWGGGMNLPNKYVNSPDLPLPANGTLPHIPVGFVESKLPWQPDLWLQVDAGWYMRGKPRHGKNVIVGTDPHVLNYDAQRQLADTFYCMQTPYMQPGDKWLPYAYDPTMHYAEPLPHSFDVCLIGLLYQGREQIINRLRESGLSVHYSIGEIFDEYRQLYCQAPIAINWSSQQDLCARVFEGMAMKRLVVTNRVPDIERMFDEDYDLVTFSSLDEAIDKILYYHQNIAEARGIAECGFEAVEQHTWDARIETILNDL